MKILTLFITFFVCLQLQAAKVPFVHKEVSDKFTALDSSITTLNSAVAAGAITEAQLAVPTADGLNAMRVARATWDFAVDGGDVGAIGLGVTLPAKAIIEHVYWYTHTQVTDGGAGTGALSCEDANNLFSAADITGNAAGAIVEGIADGTTTNFVSDISAACELTWTIGTAAATAGKLIFYVHYTVAE
jgi:hypothetical protein